MISSRSSARLALAALAVMALTLAGCGRKGFLDLPPSAAVSQPNADGATAQSDGAAAPPTINPLGWLESPPDEQPVGAKGAKKRIILDKILD